MDAREIESLAMLARGFVDLRDANPELAYRVILDILSGINEFVIYLFNLLSWPNMRRCFAATKQSAATSTHPVGCSRTVVSCGRAK